MSYGTADKALKLDIRRSPSNPNTQQQSSPGSPGTKALTMSTKPSLTPSPTSPTAKSPQRSPLAEKKSMPQFLQQLLPSKDKSPSPSAHKPTPALATPEPELTPEKPSTPELSRSSLNRKHSLSPLRKSPTPPEVINKTPALQRSTEPVHLGVNQQVRRLSGHSLSPAKNAPSLAVAIATGALGTMGMQTEKSPEIKKRERKQATADRNERPKLSETTKRLDQKYQEIQRDHQEDFMQAERGERREHFDTRKTQLEELESQQQLKRKEQREKLEQTQRDKQAEWIEWVEKANGNNAALQNKNHTNNHNNNHKKQNVSTLTNPTIQISAPPPAKEPISPSPLNSPLSLAEKHDDVHTSNEFMLVVFDKHSKVKDKNKQDSFELDLEDALQPPPISISSPDLASLEFTNLHTFPLRRSVSSTELLYERAMARFYEAVELEEAEKARKLRNIQDKEKHKESEKGWEKDMEKPIAGGGLQPPFVRKRLGSMTEAERLSFERRSELRRQSESFVQDLKTAVARWGSRENLSGTKMLSRTTGMLLNKDESRDEDERGAEDYDAEDYDDLLEGDTASGYQARAEPTKQASFEIESDYTESTASSEDDSIEKFKMELRARTKTPSPPRASPPRDHMETYHPRNMSAGVFTPYRAALPDNAAVVLTRPAPLTDPDFVPKPILKRPSNENVQPLVEAALGNNNNNNSNNNVRKNSLENVESLSDNHKDQNANNTASQEKSGFAESFMSFFKRDARSNAEKTTEENAGASALTGKPIPLSPTVVAAELEAQRKAKEEENAKRQEAERAMREESYAVVDHYSDIVSQISTTRKYHTPLYLDKNELQKAGDKRDYDEEMRMRRSQSPDGGLMPPISNKPRLSISERGQLVHVRETGSGMAYTEHPKEAVPDTPTPSEDSSQAFIMPSVKESKPPTINNKVNTTTPITPTTTTIMSELLANDESTTAEVISETTYERPDSRGRTRIVKVKRIIKKRVPSRSRDASLNRPPSSAASQQDIDFEIPNESQAPVRRRVLSRTRTSTGQSKSPGPYGRRPLPAASAMATGVLPPPPEVLLSMIANEKQETKSVEQLEEEAHEKVRSALSYSTDLVLFMVACYVYLFKDAWLVLPILSLMIYRQLGDFINDCIPKWMKRKKN
uniref:Uncharacterized protein n=1 Tax=Zeugodacus cucurbitae TaxID=28588 RepID=A0A0A1X704_ZEUCU